MVTYLVIAVFVIVLVGVGVQSRRRTRSVGEFFLGGRDVGPWLSAFAYGTTYFSAVLFVGYAGKVGYGFGLSSLWIVVGNALLGTLLAWLVLAKRTRLMTERLGAMTMPEFLAVRFDSRWLKPVAAIVIFVFLVPYSASVYSGLGYLFEEVLGIDYTVALWVMAALTAVYLVLGGYIAVARNDLIQGLVMVVGVIMMVGYVVRAPEVGGFGAASTSSRRRRRRPSRCGRRGTCRRSPGRPSSSRRPSSCSRSCCSRASGCGGCRRWCTSSTPSATRRSCARRS